MLKRIHKILHQDDDPPNRIEETIEAIKSAITEITSQLHTVNSTIKAHGTKLQELTSHQEELEKKAKKAYLLKQPQQAKTYWNESKLYAFQIQKYQLLSESATTTRNKLIEKKSELEYQSDQLLSQKSLGAINANASQLHAEIMEHLMLLSNDDELSNYQEQVYIADSRIQAMKDLNEDIPNFISEEQPIDDLEELSNAITSDKNEQQEANLDKARIQYKNFFAEPVEKPNNEEVERKKALLNSLLLKSEDEKKMAVEQFFKEDSSQKTTSENQDRIKNFFKED